MGLNTKYEVKLVRLSDVLDTIDELEDSLTGAVTMFSGEKVDKLVQDVGKVQGVKAARSKLISIFGGAT